MGSLTPLLQHRQQGANPDAHWECKPSDEFLLFSRNTHKEHFTGLGRVSGFRYVAPQTSSWVLSDPLPSPQLSDPLCPASLPGGTAAGLLQEPQQICCMSNTSLGCRQNLMVSAVPHGLETRVVPGEMSAPTANTAEEQMKENRYESSSSESHKLQ